GGKVLGHQARYGGLYGTAEAWHRFKFTDAKIGMPIIGAASLFMAIVLVVGGVFLRWPRRRSAWKSAVRLNPRLRGRAFSLNLHTTTGVYASIVLFVVAATAVPLSLGWAKNVLYALTGSVEISEDAQRAAAAKKGHAATMAIPMELAWERARALVPGPLRLAYLRYPVKPGEPIEIALNEESTPHSDARSYVYVDPANGKVLSYRPYAALSLGAKTYLWFLALHTGHFGGLPVQVLMLLGMIGATTIGYTGVESFIRKSLRRPRQTPASASLHVRVAAIRDEASAIRTFALVAANGTTLPPAPAGAHIDVRLPSGLLRQYSLTNGPGDDAGGYHIAVRLASDSRGGSAAMHALREGDTLTISAPRNRFPLYAGARHHVLIAAGIGITPLYAMVRHLDASGASYELHYFTRSPAATAFRESLGAARYADRVHFHFGVARERIQLILRDLLGARPDGAHLYVCGPAQFMALVQDAAAHAWPTEAIHREHFAADPLAEASPAAAFDLTLARSGRTVGVPEGASILQVLAECGVAVDSSCEQGLCGTCATRVLDGEPDHRDVFLTEAERRRGDTMLVCVSRAKGDHLVLDL
ncbi:MAG: PepSY domain-containing protein, partial [Candidatus Eremiobacteraeota bacterium]|nr:PepSY domain-containing protein [Candidatus Eremiobacteraeota bacterium]